MGVRLFPCHGCPLRDGCELREMFRAKVAGVGLTHAGFKCSRIDREIRKGRRIIISQPVAVHDNGPDGYTIERRQVWATITAVVSGYRFASTVDPGQVPAEPDADKFRFRKTQRHWRIISFGGDDQPDREVCRNGNVKLDNGCDYRPDSECRCTSENATATALADMNTECGRLKHVEACRDRRSEILPQQSGR